MLKSTQQELNVRKRDGRVLSFAHGLIQNAIKKAFCAEQGHNDLSQLDDTILQKIEDITAAVVDAVKDQAASDDGVTVEHIQDVVERQLMKAEYFSVARRYILYRAEHNKIRQLRADERMDSSEPFPKIMVTRDGQLENLDFDRLRTQVTDACEGFGENCSTDELLEEVEKQFFNGITPREIGRSMVLAARARIENDPDYDIVAGRLVLNIIYRESLNKSSTGDAELAGLYRDQFANFIDVGIEAGRITPELRTFDLERLADAIDSTRDGLFPYLGLQTIYDRYLLHIDGRRFEAPQYFWMRVAMGLSILEENKTDRAIEFYNVLSQFRFTSATPTLFNAGTLHPQLSSCYLSTVSDDLDGIFKAIADNAKLSKWAGGLGNDWTPVRGMGAHIKG
ncbi:MAG: ATP cone domain-containing protein, partial [Mariniblastus sp.]|nr:ATP cone domain-containing protein [Mariniblastus sp.]